MALRTIHEPARETPVRYETQVLVVGGGSAGVTAAVAAARNGADVTLVERTTYLGGLATGGLIILLLTMDDGRGNQVIGGICQEAVERMSARGGAYAPARGDWGSADEALIERERRWGLVNGHGPHAVRYSIAYDAEEMKFAFEQLCLEAGVRLLYGTVASEPVVEDGKITAVTFQGKGERFAIAAEVVIDATGDGDLFAAGGCAFESEAVSPWLWFTMGGVDVERAEGALGRRFFRTMGKGQVLLPWGATDRVARRIDATKPEDIAYAATECRKLVMAEADSLRREAPGFEEAYLCHIADQLDVTESRRLSGLYTMDRDDIDRPFEDVIAVTGHWTKYGALYHIPYRSLLTRELPNLLVAGRCISVDHRVHHATKEIPACMATGEAAGTAAALALAAEVSPTALDVTKLQERLVAKGAILWPGA